MYFLISQINYKIGCRSSEHVFYFRRNRTASQFFNHQSSQFQAVYHTVRIDTAFETERSIRIQAMTAGCLTHPCRMEISTFNEYICRSFRRTGVQSAEYTGNTHGLFLVTNHQVAFVQFTFHLIQRNERSSFRHCLYNYFIAFYLSGIEAVQRLTESMNDIISNIHYIINRTHPDQTQFVLQPFRAFLHSDTFHRNTGIMRTSFAVFHLHFNIQVMVFHFKTVYRRTLQSSLFAVLNQISVQVTSHPIVRASVRTVRRNVHFKHIVALDIIIILGKRTRNSIFRQYDNTCMIRTDTDFVFGTNHTSRFHPTDF